MPNYGVTAISAVDAMYNVIRELMQKYLGKGYKLYRYYSYRYPYRYYSSPKVYKDLWANQTVAIGTCMSNRQGLPKPVAKFQLKKGQTCKK